jgi:EAL domain-containing protein (putative c-di-GMP-specific phosphodiesterase class I)
VAEGIEDAAQAAELALLGCRTAQGYHFARPLPAEAMDKLVDSSADEWPSLPAPRQPVLAADGYVAG